MLEQLAVELQHLAGQHRGEAAAVHVLPQLRDHAHGHVGRVRVGFQQVAEAVLRQQAHVFGEHGEQAAHQELRHRVRCVAAAFQRLGKVGQLRRDLAGDACGFAAGVQRQRIQPEAAQAVQDLRLAQVVERDAVAARVREWHVAAAAAAELGIQLDAVAHVHHHQEWRAALGCRQGAGIVLRLRMRAQHGFVEALGVRAGLELLGFQHERAAPVQVHAPGALAAIGMLEGQRALEHVVLFGGGVRAVHAQQFAQLDEETLRGRELRSADALPFGDEPLCRGNVRVGHLILPSQGGYRTLPSDAPAKARFADLPRCDVGPAPSPSTGRSRGRYRRQRWRYSRSRALIFRGFLRGLGPSNTSLASARPSSFLRGAPRRTYSLSIWPRRKLRG